MSTLGTTLVAVATTTAIAVVLLVGGTAIEFGALEGARRDLRDAHKADQRRPPLNDGG
jgi:hypothetical protein